MAQLALPQALQVLTTACWVTENEREVLAWAKKGLHSSDAFLPWQLAREAQRRLARSGWERPKYLPLPWLFCFGNNWGQGYCDHSKDQLVSLQPLDCAQALHAALGCLTLLQHGSTGFNADTHQFQRESETVSVCRYFRN